MGKCWRSNAARISPAAIRASWHGIVRSRIVGSVRLFRPRLVRGPLQQLTGTCVEKCFQLPCSFAAEPRHTCDVFETRHAQALHGTEFFQQRRFAPLADTGEFVEYALGYFFDAELSIV